jgi:hypothetical protein
VGGAVTDAAWIFAVVLILLVLAAAALASRRYLLERSGGTVECALRRLTPAGRPASAGTDGPVSPGWRLGVLAYQRDELRWYGALGVLLRPEHVFQRRALTVVSRRPATDAEAVTLGVDRVVVEIAAKPLADSSGSPPGERVALAMSEQALTGFLAWLEASPPGSHLGTFTLPLAPSPAPQPLPIFPAASEPQLATPAPARPLPPRPSQSAPARVASCRVPGRPGRASRPLSQRSCVPASAAAAVRPGSCRRGRALWPPPWSCVPASAVSASQTLPFAAHPYSGPMVHRTSSIGPMRHRASFVPAL